MQKINSTGVAAAAAAATAAAVANNNNNNSIREHESEHVLNVLCCLLLLSFSFYISTLHVSCFIIAGISKFESSALCVLVFILLCVVVMSQCRIQILVFTLSYHFSFVMSNLLAPYICSLFSWTEMPFGMLIFGVHVCVCVLGPFLLPYSPQRLLSFMFDIVFFGYRFCLLLHGWSLCIGKTGYVLLICWFSTFWLILSTCCAWFWITSTATVFNRQCSARHFYYSKTALNTKSPLRVIVVMLSDGGTFAFILSLSIYSNYLWEFPMCTKQSQKPGPVNFRDFDLHLSVESWLCQKANIEAVFSLTPRPQCSRATATLVYLSK